MCPSTPTHTPALMSGGVVCQACSVTIRGVPGSKLRVRTGKDLELAELSKP